MTPLEEYMERPEDTREVGYPFVRCAGLFIGYGEYAGANLGEEIVFALSEKAIMHASAAAKIRR
jgi:hypothetical protein